MKNCQKVKTTLNAQLIGKQYVCILKFGLILSNFYSWLFSSILSKSGEITLHLIWNEILSRIFEIHDNGPWITVYSTNLAIKTILVCTKSDFLPKNCTKSHQYLINVQCCNRRNHGQTIRPTEIFISMNLLQMPCVIKRSASSSEK